MREHTITVSIRCLKKLLWFNRGWRVWWWLKHGVNLKTYSLFYMFHALHIAGTLFAIMREGKVSKKLRVYEESSSPRVLMDVMKSWMALGMRCFISPLAYAEWGLFQPSLLWGETQWQWQKERQMENAAVLLCQCHVPRAGPDLLSLPGSGSPGHYVQVLAACIRGRFPDTVCPPGGCSTRLPSSLSVCVPASPQRPDSVTVERRTGNSENFGFFPIKYSYIGL